MSEVAERLLRVEDLRSAKYITGTLRDISAIEIKQVRDRFERNERVADELREVYQQVWTLNERAGGATIQAKNNKVLHVAFTTNRHFYGALNHDVMQKFTSDTDSSNQCLIIGDTGKEIWLSNAKKRREVAFVSFSEDSPNLKETSEFLNRVSRYGRVFVYYPGFVSVFVQKPAVLDVTFRPSKNTSSDKGEHAENTLETKEEMNFLLEPDLAEMVEFFNTQVRYVLFERMLLETQLSRIAARLVKMDTADQNTDYLILHEQRELNRAHASFSSRRMIETIVGYLQWHTRKI